MTRVAWYPGVSNKGTGSGDSELESERAREIEALKAQF